MEAALLMERAEWLRTVGPFSCMKSGLEAGQLAETIPPMDTMVASSGSSSSDWGVKQVVEEAGEGESPAFKAGTTEVSREGRFMSIPFVAEWWWWL